MKKIISVFLCLLMLIPLSCVFFSASAANVSISQGKDALVAQWDKGEGRGFDYRAYSPVRDQNDTTKYPLVVILHGNQSGSKEGEQLTASEFYNWSSSEYQARFKMQAVLLSSCPEPRAVMSTHGLTHLSILI